MTANPSPTRYLSGVQSSGRLHLGNYYGAVKNHIGFQTQGDCFYFIANYHSLTTVHNAAQMERFTFMVAADYLALGLDPTKACIFRQSDVPEVAELSWILSCVTGMGLLERAHSYKDKLAKGIAASAGLFTYPCLMAADILMYRSDKVPVGIDQVQHVEMTRDMAGYFNQAFGKSVFRLPEAVVSPVPKVMGLTGGKMSKSDEASVLPIFAEPSEIKKKIMAIVTDSKGVDEPKDPDTNTIYMLYKLMATDEESQALAADFRKGGMGYGDAKKRLLAKVEATFGGEVRERRKVYDQRPDLVEDILLAGAQRARKEAARTMSAVYEVVGIPRSKIKDQLLSVL